MEPWNKCVWCSGGHSLAFKPFLVFVATWAPNAVYAAKVHLLPISPNTLSVGSSPGTPGLGPTEPLRFLVALCFCVTPDCSRGSRGEPLGI